MERDSQPGPPGEHEHVSPDDVATDAFFSNRRCCCFYIPWSTTNSSSWERIQLGSDTYPTRRSPSSPAQTRWWSSGARAFMKIREWSELVAGPRWKTFIRRFNRNGRSSATSNAARFGSTRFQYDPLSYTLNFDEGHGTSPEGEYTGYRDFSTRFAMPPGSAKSSMDLGGRDAPPLFTAP